MSGTILIALPKGRLGDETLERLAGTPFALDAAALKGRALRIPTATPGVLTHPTQRRKPWPTS